MKNIFTPTILAVLLFITMPTQAEITDDDMAHCGILEVSLKTAASSLKQGELVYNVVETLRVDIDPIVNKECGYTSRGVAVEFVDGLVSIQLLSGIEGASFITTDMFINKLTLECYNESNEGDELDDCSEKEELDDEESVEADGNDEFNFTDFDETDD